MRDKYYVRCGELEKLVLAENPQDAADKAFDLCNGETIDPYMVYIDSRGYRGPTYNNGVVTCTTDDLEPEWKIQTDDVIATFGEDEDE